MNEIYKKVDKKLRQYSRRPIIFSKYVLDRKPDNSRYIFHHMPKCGGTSAVDALTNWFIVLKDYPVGWSDEDNYPVYQKFCNHPKNLDKIKPYQLIVGHYHLDKSHLSQRYPDWKNKGYRLFTFLREPLDLQISLYYYEIRNRRIPTNTPIEERLLLRNNYMAFSLQCDEDNYLDVLEQYFFIGIMEKYQQSFNLLSNMMDKPSVKLKNYNCGSRQKYNLSASFIDEFRAKNQLDYKIYDYGKGFLGRKLQENGLIREPELVS